MTRTKMTRNVRRALVGPTLVALATLAMAAPSCAPAQERIVVLAGDDPTGTFADEAGSADTGVETQSDGEIALTEYCPSNKCPIGRTTCLGSAFLCDVDLQTDEFNCGECGRRCDGPNGNGSASYQCTGARCLMACRNPPFNIDCNGLIEDGCETESTTNDNCGACGVQCHDPEKPCVKTNDEYRCGCPQGMLLCPDGSGTPTCIDPNNDDANCGTCQNACDPAGDGSPPPPNTHFGCVGGRCGEPKCESDFQNCDKDWGNGCEAWLRSNDNCGSCGNVCAPGLDCKGNKTMTPTCSCPGNGVYCEFMGIDIGETHLSYAGECADFGSNRDHCGGCFRSCPYATNYSNSTCDFGICRRICNAGRADCNGSMADDCEVNTDSDPRNCGGCGITCDAIAGQACVFGRCVVEPCPPVIEDGGIPR